MKPSTPIRGWLVAACLFSWLAVACGDDDDTVPQGMAGMTGDAGSDESGSAHAGNPGNPGDPGGPSAGNPSGGSGGAGSPIGGSPSDLPGAGAGGSPDAPRGFTAFVHDLVENQTQDANTPAKLEEFADATDDHGHYVVPASDFDDLF